MLTVLIEKQTFWAYSFLTFCKCYFFLSEMEQAKAHSPSLMPASLYIKSVQQGARDGGGWLTEYIFDFSSKKPH